MMGVAGILIPPDDHWPRVAELLRDHGICLIFDEVVTGRGRTDHWFGADPFGTEPDIIVSVKGLSASLSPISTGLRPLQAD
jgi:PLP-dependent transaminase